MIATITWVRHLLHLPTTAYNVIAHALFAGLNAQIISAGVIIIVVVQITTDFGKIHVISQEQALANMPRTSYMKNLSK